MMKKVQFQASTALIVTLAFLCVIWQILARWQFSVSIEPLQPEAQPVAPLSDKQPVATQTTGTAAISTSTPTPTIPAANLPKTNTKELAILRVSNQTQHPLRLALLSKLSAPKSTGKQPAYAHPAHWDFEPGEGGNRGLTLALPEGNIMLNRGDILIAFAQDGSRLYWGPYVVGETPTPIWNSQTSEWQLILQP
jgi:hypothetical protein